MQGPSESLTSEIPRRARSMFVGPYLTASRRDLATAAASGGTLAYPHLGVHALASVVEWGTAAVVDFAATSSGAWCHLARTHELSAGSVTVRHLPRRYRLRRIFLALTPGLGCPRLACRIVNQ